MHIFYKVKVTFPGNNRLLWSSHLVFFQYAIFESGLKVNEMNTVSIGLLEHVSFMTYFMSVCHMLLIN